jgi:diphosphomevalonate decarboxylase
MNRILEATSRAHSNIALIKYWGKRDSVLNLPAVGSIAITLREMFTVTTVTFDKKLKNDRLVINDRNADQGEKERVFRFLDLIRQQSKLPSAAEVISHNNFPTGAGLASSASAFASLALAGSAAAGISLDKSALSRLARRGSGSAPRSIFGGFTEMKKGEREDGADAIAVQLADENYWNIRLLIAVTSEEKKKTGSTEGMNLTAETSPYYPQWIASSPVDLQEMRQAIVGKDFEKLGELSEFSCLKMHAVMMSANPGLIYWNGATLDCIYAVREMRKSGIPVYFTIDAGPQVKVICLEKDAEIIQEQLRNLTGIKNIISTGLGPGASLLEG